MYNYAIFYAINYNKKILAILEMFCENLVVTFKVRTVIVIENAYSLAEYFLQTK